MHPEKWSPARSKGLDLWVHIRLMGQLVALAGVTTETGSDDVVPTGAPALVARGDVVEVKLSFG